MITHPLNPGRSEKGVALIIVMLLLSVMAGLTAAMALSGQTEIAMASNEVYYAGARAAAEAGMNRAIEQITADTATDLLAGADGLVDVGNPAAAVNIDNGDVPNLGKASFNLGPLYSYRFQIFDDDDPSLYPVALTGPQLAKMGEDGSAYTNVNNRLILRATGLGPKGTTVSLSRLLRSLDTTLYTTTENRSNPAILVNGNLNLNGTVTVSGFDKVTGKLTEGTAQYGSMYANGNITSNGSSEVTGTIKATGTVDGLTDGGKVFGGMSPVTVPEVRAMDFKSLADWVLTSGGQITNNSTGVVCVANCPKGWSFKDGTWSVTGDPPSSATYYVEGAVAINGVGKQQEFTALSVIAEGSITITGNGQFTPANTSKIQFVTNGDFVSNAAVDAPLNSDGQIMVREQLNLLGGFTFQGRLLVEDRDGAANVYDAVTNPNGRRGSSLVDSNNLSGNVSLGYSGSLADFVDVIVTPNPTTYINDFFGWLES